eukprot:scaffold69302_cov68-Phaeocystis_antarctica.AAC.6
MVARTTSGSAPNSALREKARRRSLLRATSSVRAFSSDGSKSLPATAHASMNHAGVTRAAMALTSAACSGAACRKWADSSSGSSECTSTVTLAQ